MIKSRLLILCFLVVQILSGSYLVAETAPKKQEPTNKIIINDGSSNKETAAYIRQQMELARRLIQQKNYEGASAVLESAYESSPNHPVVVSQWLTVLDKLKQYPRAIDILKRLPESRQKDMFTLLKFAEFMIKQDSTEAALGYYKKSVATIPDGNKNRFASVINNLLLYNFGDYAFELVDSIRLLSNDSTLFANQKGAVFEQKREYGLAALEFAKQLSDTTRLATNAERKLISLLDFQESSDVTEQALLSIVGVMDNARLMTILSSHYLKSDKFELAFNYALRQDSLANNNGATLFKFVQACRERSLFHETVRMARYIVEQFPQSVIIYQTYFALAEALLMTDQPYPAIAIYDSIVTLTPTDQDKALALYEIGRIYSEKFDDCATAIKYYDSVTSRYPVGIGNIDAQMARPKCRIKEAGLAVARSEYLRLSTKRLDENRLEEISFRIAQIDFFTHKFDSAEVQFQKLIIDYPLGYYVNDVLKLLNVMLSADSDNDLLQIYSEALYFDFQHKVESSTQRFEQLVTSPKQILADIAIYELTQMSIRESDTARTLELIEKMSVDYPESYYLPYGLKTKGDIFCLESKTKEEGLQIYRELLEKSPNYPFVSEIRAILKDSYQAAELES